MTATAARLRVGPPPLQRPDWLPSAIWPFETQTVDVDGVRIAVHDIGRGPTLLLYTGIGSFVWRDVMRRLAPDFRCVVLDPPGIGLSARTPRSMTTLGLAARAAGAVLQTFDLTNVTLVLHDTAGPTAIAAAGRMPERIRGIVGVNTFGWRPSGPAFRGMLAVMGSPLMRRVNLTTGVLARVTASPFGAGRQLDDASRRAYRAGFARSMGAFHDYLRDARVNSRFYDDVTRALTGPFRHLPVLTIFGERNDPFGFQPQWKQLFPNARQMVVAGGNHFPMCDAPDLVADAIRTWHRETIFQAREKR